MFESTLLLVVCIVVGVYMFRKPIQQLNNDAPKVIENVITSAVKASKQLDVIVSKNCLTNQIECERVVTALYKQVQEEKLMNVDDAYDKIMNRARVTE